MDTTLPQSDHDLLIRMDENLRNLRADMASLTGDTTKKLDDHEARLRRMEKYVWLAIGALTLLQFAIPLLQIKL